MNNTLNTKGKNEYEIKVKALAEAKKYFTIRANSKEDAIKKMREKLDSGYLGDQDYEDWDVTYLMDNYCLKITNVSNTKKEGDSVENDYEGVEETPICWPIR